MKRTTEQTAQLLALCFNRSEQSRARVSLKTVRLLSGRVKIRAVFANELRDRLDVLGIILTELDRGGYGLLRRSALEGAPAVTAAKYLGDHLPKLKQGKMRPSDWDAVVSEIDDADDEFDPEDDDGG